MTINTEMSFLYSPRSTSSTFLEGSPQEIHNKLSLEDELNSNNKTASLSKSSHTKSPLSNSDYLIQQLNRERLVAQSLIVYLQDEQYNRRFRIPQTKEDLKASHLFISLHSQIEKKEAPFEQFRQFEILINRIQLHIDHQIDPQLLSLTKTKLPVAEQLRKIISKSNDKINNSNDAFLHLSEFTRPMLDAYYKGIEAHDENLNTISYEGLTKCERRLVKRMIRKYPSYKAYVQRSSCLWMQTLPSLSRLGADYDRHIPYVHMYDQLGKSALYSFNSSLDLESPFIKLGEIEQWLKIFCEKCIIGEELTVELFNKWNALIKSFETSEEIVPKTAQAFFEHILELSDENSNNSYEKKQALKRLATCMAAISQKLYSEPGICVGQTTKPDGHASAYADIPKQKCIDIIFDSAGDLIITAVIEKEVNPWMKGNHGKQEFLEFPNVRLKMINTLYSNLFQFKGWSADFNLEIGIEQDATGISADPVHIYKKVIKPLNKAGFIINSDIYHYKKS